MGGDCLMQIVGMGFRAKKVESYGHKLKLCKVTCIGRIGCVFKFGIGVYHSVY